MIKKCINVLALALLCTLLLTSCTNISTTTSEDVPNPPTENPTTPSTGSSNQPDDPSTESPSPTEEISAPSGDNSTSTEPEQPNGSNNEQINEQLASMTLDEKVGQMIIAGIDGTVLDTNAQQLIAAEHIGGTILYADNITDLNGMVALINSLKKANASNPAPLFISVDQEGGQVSRMPKEFTAIPANEVVGLKNDADLARTMGTLLARELKLTGFNIDFAPVLDVNSNPNNPVIGDRSFGSSSALVTKLGIADMEGIRSEGIIPVVKHYPGHGDTSVDSHLDLPIVNKTAEQLAQVEWPPFEAAVNDHAEAVMVAHILYPKLDPNKPASLSKAIIGQELRGKLGYDGVVITDDLGMGAIKKHFGLAEAALDTVNAGSDILLIAHGYDDAKLAKDALLKAVKDGTINESRIDESVRRILALKQSYKLNDQPVAVPNLTELNADINKWLKEVKS